MSIIEFQNEQKVDALACQDPLYLLNIPFDSEPVMVGARCFACEMPALCHALWGRNY